MLPSSLAPELTVPAEKDLIRWDRLFLLGLLLMSLQFVGVSVAQVGHLWGAGVFALLLLRGEARASVFEAAVLVVFVAVAVINTRYSGAPHVKAGQQVLKFALVYPAFYLVGRFYGRHYLQRALPFGFWMVVAFLALQWLVQHFEVPVIFQQLNFQRDAVHGTFKERNWFAVFFFFVSYLLLLKSAGNWRSALSFLGLGVGLTLLSGSKSILVVCGIALLFNYRGHLTLKVFAVLAGAVIFVELFGYQLSGEMLRIRLENERGLAFVLSTELIERNLLGYGFGFVEAHFSRWWIGVQGLGYGTNSVFAAPLDLMLIAGPFGLALWLVFFGGLGLGWRTMLLLSPVAAWSLINPLHQSEIVYLMTGYLVSWGMASREGARGLAAAPLRKAESPSTVAGAVS